MDFWRRIILPSPATKPDKSPPVSPEARLERYKRGWQAIQKAWAALCNPQTIQHTSALQQQLISHLQLQNRLLRDRVASKLCLEYTLRQRIVPTIVKIARNSPSQVATEIIRCLVALIDVSDEEFLTDESVYLSISELAGSFHGGLDDDYREALMELLFNVAATTKVRKPLLSLWFNLESGRGRDGQSISETSALDNDFPIFYALLDNVPAEGRVGDFAKTGLLYFIELAKEGDELEEWILSSDLATMMAAGLGASYSQLPRKIIIVPPPEGTVPTLLSADDTSSSDPPAHLEEFERTDSPAFTDALDNFLRYLGFWQDVLDHCGSLRIRTSLLETFKALFLQQLLYPSLLESSERDSVAILTYLRIILEVLEHEDLAHLMLSYLMGDTKEVPVSPKRRRLRRPSTMNLLRALPSDDSLANTPRLLSAADLIMGNLKAKREERVIATLRLVSTLLKRHCGYTINTLLRTTSHTKDQVTVGHHEKEMELFLGLISPAGLAEQGSQSYDSYVRDAYINLEIHPCSENVLQSLISSPKPTKAPSVTFHTIRQDDPLMKDLLRLFSSFFTNCVELNLWLTRVVVDLCACRFRTMEGWLLFRPEDGYIEDDAFINTLVPENHSRLADNLLAEFSEMTTELENEDSDSDSDDFAFDQSRKADLARRKPTFTRFPPLFTMLKTLRAQVAHYRSELMDDDFDQLIEERRQALGFLDGISSAMNTAHHTPSKSKQKRSPFMSPSSTPSRSVQTGSLHSRESSTSSSVRATGSSMNAPFAGHFEKTKKLIQPLFPMGMDNISNPSSPENSFADLEEIDVKRNTGEFEPPEEISLGRLLNNIIEFVKEVTALVQCRRIMFEPVRYF